MCGTYAKLIKIYGHQIINIDEVTAIGYLTYRGRVTHICVSKLTIIGSDNGLSPGRCQAIIWTNAGMLLIWTLGTNFSEILNEIHAFSFKKMHLKMSSATRRPFCLGLNVLMQRSGLMSMLGCTKAWNAVCRQLSMTPSLTRSGSTVCGQTNSLICWKPRSDEIYDDPFCYRSLTLICRLIDAVPFSERMPEYC